MPPSLAATPAHPNPPSNPTHPNPIPPQSHPTRPIPNAQIDDGGTLDLDELRQLLYSLRDKASDAARQEAQLQARAALLHLASKASQSNVEETIRADEQAVAAAKEEQQRAEQQKAEEREKAKAAKAAKAAEKAKKEAEEKAAFDARVAARKEKAHK